MFTVRQQIADEVLKFYGGLLARVCLSMVGYVYKCIPSWVVQGAWRLWLTVAQGDQVDLFQPEDFTFFFLWTPGNICCSILRNTHPLDTITAGVIVNAWLLNWYQCRTRFEPSPIRLFHSSFTLSHTQTQRHSHILIYSHEQILTDLHIPQINLWTSRICFDKYINIRVHRACTNIHCWKTEVYTTSYKRLERPQQE